MGKKVKLDREDLISLVKGSCPNLTAVEYFTDVGYVQAGHGSPKWVWMSGFEEDLTDDDLWHLYQACKESWKTKEEMFEQRYGPFRPISEWEKECIMTIEDLEVSVECGAITGWDGWGAFLVERDGVLMRGETFDPEDLDFDIIKKDIKLVLWYNK